MKKILKITLLVVAAILLLLLVLPIAFKGKIVKLVQSEANKNLNAEVSFEDIDLSLFRSFPNISVQIERPVVANVAPFSGDTLLAAHRLGLTVDILSILKGSQVKVVEVALEQPRIQIKVLEDGRANYDIALAADSTAAADTASSSGFEIVLDSYSIDNGYLLYDDASLPMVLTLADFEHSGRGNFAEEVFTLYTRTRAEAITLSYDEVQYLRKVSAVLDANIAMDLKQMKFTFMDNELRVNDLNVAFDGWLAMPDEPIDMDLTFQSSNTDLKAILSLIPAEFASNLEGVKAGGDFSFGGYAKGTYTETQMPGFGLDLAITGGEVQYPDLPKSLTNISVKAEIKSPQGSDLDRMTIHVPVMHLEVGTDGANVVDGRLMLKNTVSDPYIDTKLDAAMNLASIKDALPLGEETALEGALDAHFELVGALSDIEAQRLEQIKAEGFAAIAQFTYAAEDMRLGIPEGRVSLSPALLRVETFKAAYEDMNLALEGYLQNYVAYALTDTTLRGELSLTVDKINADRYMASEDTLAATGADTAAAEVLLVPEDLDVVLKAEIGELLYDSLLIRDITGSIAIKEEVASLNSLRMNLLKGSALVNGFYSTVNHEKPQAQVDVELNEIDAGETFQAFNTVQQLAPIARNTEGRITATLSISTELQPSLEPIYSSLNGSGSLRSKQLIISGSSTMQKIANVLKTPALATQTIKDVNLTFTIEDGKLITAPFDVALGTIAAKVSGYSTFEEKIDYLIQLQVPSGALGADITKVVGSIAGNANDALGTNLSVGGKLNVALRLHGNLYDPTVTPSIEGITAANVKEQALEAVKEKVEETIDQVKEEASKKAEELLKDAQREADKLIAEAKQLATTMRREADEQAKKLVDQAGNPFAKKAAELAGNKLREEADKKADALEREAQAKADALLKKAREEAEKLK